MTSGNTTSEYKLGSKLIYFSIAIAVIVTAVDLPFTPEGVQLYFTTIAESAKEWAEVLGAPIAAFTSVYAVGRTYIKSK